MKKITILATLALIFTFFSCDRSKDCKCTVTETTTIDSVESTPHIDEVGVYIEKGECSELDGTVVTELDENTFLSKSQTCVEL